MTFVILSLKKPQRHVSARWFKSTYSGIRSAAESNREHGQPDCKEASGSAWTYEMRQQQPLMQAEATESGAAHLKTFFSPFSPNSLVTGWQQ